MTATGHAVIGVALGAKIINPVIGLPVSFLAHFLCDKVPHWDPMTNKSKTKNQVLRDTIIDVIVSFSLVFILWRLFFPTSSGVYLFLMAFVSQLPDWLEMPKLLLGINIPGADLNLKIQRWFHDVGFNSRLNAPWGVITQAIVVLFVFFWALR